MYILLTLSLKQSERGQKIATLDVSLHWEKPYKTEVVPVVSLLDHRHEAKEFKGSDVEPIQVASNESVQSPKVEPSVGEALAQVASPQATAQPTPPTQLQKANSQVQITDSMAASLDQVASSTDLLAFAQSKLSKPASANELVINIRKVTWDTHLPRTQDLLQSVSQIFVSFDFLSFAPEELETHSCPLERSGSESLFAYSKSMFF